MAPCERSRGPARVPLCPRAAATRLRRSCGLLRCAAHASRLRPWQAAGPHPRRLPSGLGLRGPPAPTGFRPPPRLGNTPALPWQGARPLTRRLRPPLPRLRGCVAVWGCARVVRLRARGLAGGCAGSPPAGPLRGGRLGAPRRGAGRAAFGPPFWARCAPRRAPCGLCAPCLFGPSCGACLLPSPPFRSSHSSALSRTAGPPLARSRGAKSAPCWPRPSAPWLLDLRRFSGSAQNARKMRRKAKKMRKTARFDKKYAEKENAL